MKKNYLFLQLALLLCCLLNFNLAQAQTVSECSGVVAYHQVDATGGWNGGVTDITINEGQSIKFGPQPNSGFTWTWTGPNGFTSSLRDPLVENFTADMAGNYVATVRGTDCMSTITYTVTVNGGGSTECFTPLYETSENLTPDPEMTDRALWDGWGSVTIETGEGAYCGTTYAKLSAPDAGCSAALDVANFTWQPETTYRLHVWVKTIGGTVGFLARGSVDNGGGDFGFAVDTEGAWMLVDRTFTTSATPTEGFVSFNTCDFGSNATEVHIDNFQLYVAPEGTDPGTAPVNVAYVTSNKAMAEGASDPILAMLQADENLNVTVHSVAGDATVDLSGADVIVAQEGFGSGDAIWMPNGPLALATLPAPTVYNKTYALRNGKAVVAGGGTSAELAGLSITVPADKQTMDLFNGITFADNAFPVFNETAADNGGEGTKSFNFTHTLTLSADNTLVATAPEITAPATTVFLNVIPAGTTVGDQVVGADMVMMGMNYGAISKGGNNMTAEGLTLWRNAVYHLAGLPVPETLVEVGGGGGTAPTHNYAENGDFEDGFLNGASWFCCGDANNPTMVEWGIESENPISGTRSARMRMINPGTANWNAMYENFFTVHKDVPITLSFKMKASAPTAFGIEIAQAYPDFAALHREDGIAVGTDVQTYEFTVTPTVSDPNFKIGFLLGMVDAGVTIWIDDVIVQETDGEWDGNIVANGGFEEATLATKPDPNVRGGWALGANVSLDETSKLTGANSMKVVASATDSLAHYLQADAGKLYTLSFDVVASEAVDFTAALDRREGGSGEFLSHTVNATTTSQTVTVTTTKPLDAMGLHKLIFKDFPDGGAEVWIDNVSLVAVEECALAATGSNDTEQFNYQINAEGDWFTGANIVVEENQTVKLGPWPTNAAYTWTWTGPNNWTFEGREPTIPAITAETAGDYTAIYTDGSCTGIMTYRVGLPEPASNVATLSGVTLNVGDISFDPATEEYNVTLPVGTNTVTVAATSTDPNATVTGAGDVDVSSGSGTATIVVTAEDGTTTKSYTINFTVGEPASNVATLSGITLSAGTITFDPATKTYNVELPSGTSSVTVNATPTDENATATGTGDVDVSSGNGTATIVVTAEDQETTDTYTINFTVAPNSIAGLASQGVNVYPNPVNGTGVLYIDRAADIVSVNVYTAQGILVKAISVANVDIIRINVADLADGLYLLKAVKNDRSVLSGKFVK